MSASQRARSAVPLELRSLAPTMSGVPWWGAIVIAAGVTLLGALLDAFRGDELTTVFSVFYVLGCIAAVVAVQHRGVFTAMAQPPLLLVAAIPLAQEFLFESSGSGLRDLALNVAYPLVNRFPAMLVATAAVLVIGGVRIYLAQQDGTADRPSRSAATSRSRAATASTSRAAAAKSGSAASKRSRPARPQASAQETDPRRERAGEATARPRTAAAGGRTRQQPDRQDQQKPARATRSDREPAATTKASVRQVADTRDNPAVRRRPADDDRSRRSEPVSRHDVDPRRLDEQPEPQAPRGARPRPPVNTPAYPPPAVRYRDRYED